MRKEDNLSNEDKWVFKYYKIFQGGGVVTKKITKDEDNSQ